MSKSGETGEKYKNPGKQGSNYASMSSGIPVVRKPPSYSKDINNNVGASLRAVSPTRSVSPSNGVAKSSHNAALPPKFPSLASDTDSAPSSISSVSTAVEVVDKTGSTDVLVNMMSREETAVTKTLVYTRNHEDGYDSDSSKSSHHYSLIDVPRKTRKTNLAQNGDGVSAKPEECQIVTEAGEEGKYNSSADDSYLALVYPANRTPEHGSNDQHHSARSSSAKSKRSVAQKDPISTVFRYTPPAGSSLDNLEPPFDDQEERSAKNEKHLSDVDYICESREYVSEFKHQWIIENLNPDFYEVGELIEGNSFPDKTSDKSDTASASTNDDAAFMFKLYPKYPPSKDDAKTCKFALTICFRTDRDKQRLLNQNHKLTFKVGFKILDENKELIYSQAIKTYIINLSKEDEIPIKQFDSELSRSLFKHYLIDDNDEALWYMNESNQVRDLYFVFDTVFLKETTENASERVSKSFDTLKVSIPPTQFCSMSEDSQSLPSAKVRVHRSHKSFEPGQVEAEVTEIKAVRLLWHLENYPSLLFDLVAPPATNGKSPARPKPWIESSFVNWKKGLGATSKKSQQDQAEEHKWELNLYPKGKDERYSGCMSLFIKHLKGPEVKVIAEFILLNPQGREISIMRLPPQSLPSGKRWGVGEYLRLSDLDELRSDSNYDDLYSMNTTPSEKTSSIKPGIFSVKNKRGNGVRFSLMCRLKIINRQTIFEPTDQQRLLPKDQAEAVDTRRHGRVEQSSTKRLYDSFYKFSKHCDMVIRLKLMASDCQRLLNSDLEGVAANEKSVETLRKRLETSSNTPVFVDFLVHKLVLSLNSTLLDEHIQEFDEAVRLGYLNVEQIMKQQLLETPLTQFSIQQPFPAVVVSTSMSALSKFIKYLYTQQLDLSIPCVQSRNQQAPQSQQVEQQDEIQRLNLLFELYELALRFEVKELLAELEERSERELVKLNYIVCWLDRLADLMMKMREEQAVLRPERQSDPVNKIFIRFALSEAKQAHFRRLKSIIMKFFIKNLNTVLKTRKDFLNVEFKLNDRRQLIYDEIWKYSSSSK